MSLPQHVTLNLHKVQASSPAALSGNAIANSQSLFSKTTGLQGGYHGNQSSATVSGNSNQHNLMLQPSAVFASQQSGATALASGAAALGLNASTSSFILLGREGQPNASTTSSSSVSPSALNLQSHLNRLNLHQQQQQRFSSSSQKKAGGGRQVEDSFVDVGTFQGSHLHLEQRHGGYHAPSVSQVVNVCTHDHVDKLNHVKELLDSFEDLVDVSEAKAKGLGDDFAAGGEEKYLCGECALLLQEQMERMISECELDCQAYQLALSKMEKESREEKATAPGSPAASPSKSAALPNNLTDEQFEREIAKCKEEERKENQKIAKLEQQLKELNQEREGLDQQAEELDKLEEHYWRQFNHYKLELDAYGEEKRALVNKIEGACAQLELLKRTNIYNDVFHIWHDGPFGTINSFRMGKTNKIQVEWDEINAAWGQAVLLLHTMASTCDEFEFSQNKLIPMGSYPKVSDGKNTYELYGPVTQFLRANYDKAMCVFLQCLHEFSIYAKEYDIAHQTKPHFQLPYKIEGDKICGHTIRLRFNVSDKWTKALKYLLANLKVTLVWLTSSGPVGKKKAAAAAAAAEAS